MTVTSRTRWYSVGIGRVVLVQAARVPGPRLVRLDHAGVRGSRSSALPQRATPCPPLGRAVEAHVEGAGVAGQHDLSGPSEQHGAAASASAAMLSSTRSRTWSRRSSGSRGAGKLSADVEVREPCEERAPRFLLALLLARHPSPLGATGCVAGRDQPVGERQPEPACQAAARSRCRRRRTSPTASRTEHPPRRADVAPMQSLLNHRSLHDRRGRRLLDERRLRRDRGVG